MPTSGHHDFPAVDDPAGGRRGIWVHRDPAALPGWPVQLDSSLEPAPVLVDLDGDAVWEVTGRRREGTG